MDLSIRKINNFHPREPESPVLETIKRDRYDFSFSEKKDPRKQKKKKGISLLPFDFVKYRKRVGAKLRPSKKFSHAPSYQEKYSNFANALLVEAHYYEERITQYECAIGHSKLSFPLAQENVIQQKALLDDLPYHRKQANGASLSEICDHYTIDDVIGFDLFGLNLDLEESILQYKAFEILGREYVRQRVLTQADKQDNALAILKSEINDEFRSYCF